MRRAVQRPEFPARHARCQGQAALNRLRPVQLVADQRKQAGLAGAIGAGNPDFLALMNRERGVGKQDPGAPAQRYISKIQHERTALKSAQTAA